MSGLERSPEPVEIAELARGPVLVFAPHPDDEVVGIGGTCRRHVLAGDAVHAVIAYDGALGNRGYEHEVPAAFVARRQAECRAACDALGYDSVHFLGHPENHELSADDLEKGAAQMAALMAKVGPRTVYAPWPGESHVDHHQLGVAVGRAFEQYAVGHEGAELWFYEIWSTFRPTRVVDITHQWPDKEHALRLHATQVSARDIVHYIEGLNAYRSLHIDRPGVTHAEAFVGSKEVTW